MPETALGQVIAELRMSLDEAITKLETQEEIARKQAAIVKRLRIFFWGAVASAVVFVVSFGLIFHEGQVRVDQIQHSRLVSCLDTEAAKRALIERDTELVNIAVQVANGRPELAATIIDRLNDSQSAEALRQVDCEEVISDDRS